MAEDQATHSTQNPFASPAITGAGHVEDGMKTKRSGWILAVVIVNFIYSMIPLLYFFTFYVFFVMMYQGWPDNQSVWMMLVFPIGIFLFPGMCFLFAGIGLIYRKQWGRILAFVIGGFMTLFGLYFIFIACMLPSLEGDDPDLLASVIGVLVMGLVFLAYPFVTYGVLLRKKYAAEFVKPVQSVPTQSEETHDLR